MDKSTILVKTEKGREAVRNHASAAVPVRARGVLVLVDGKTTVEELLRKASLLSNVDQHLEWLFREGFVADVRSAAAGGSPAASSTAAAPATPVASGSPGLSAAAKAVIQQEVVEFLGPMGALVCDEVWPRCHDVEGALVLLSADLNASQAQQFIQRVRRRLG